MRKLTFIVFGISLPFIVSAMDIIFAVSSKPGSLHADTAAQFSELLQEKLGDEYKIKFYHSSQLGKDKDLMQKLKLGTVHLSLLLYYGIYCTRVCCV